MEQVTKLKYTTCSEMQSVSESLAAGFSSQPLGLRSLDVYDLPWKHPCNQHMKRPTSNTLWLGYMYSNVINNNYTHYSTGGVNMEE